MDDDDGRDSAEPVGSDPVATSRSLELAAERLLARAGVDDRRAREVRTACRQLAADRTNGEDLDDSIHRLRELLARAADETSP